MAEETIITNVGEDDRSSVASEATLLALVSAIEKLAKAAGINPTSARAKVEKAAVESTKVSIKEAEKNTNATRDNTGELKDATKAVSAFSRSFGVVTAIFGGAAGAGTNFVKTLINGGNTLTEFAQHVPLVGDRLSILTGLIDQNISNFRELSQIGAVFGNGLNDIRLIAAQAGTPLSEFVEFIQQNSDSMKLFGSNTAVGAREFARLSKELRDGVGRDLINLGFTSSELNELLVDYAELQARQFTRDRTQGRVTAENAAAFGEELIRITAITGKRREQIQAELRQQQQDIRIRAARSRLEATEGERFTLNLAMVSGSSNELANALVDINDGIPSGEVTRNLQVFSETFRNAGQDISEMDPEEFNNFVVGVRQDLEEFARSQGKTLEELSSMPGFEGMFGIIGELQGFREITAENREQMIAAMEAERNRENALKNFQENLNVLRGQLMETFIDSGILPRITELFESFIGWLGRSSVIDSFMNAVSRAVDFLLGPSINVGGDDPTEAIYERQGGFIDRILADIEEKGIGQVMKDLFVSLGSTLMESAWTAITDGIKSLWEDTRLIDYMIAGIAALWASRALATAITAGISGLFARAALPAAAGGAVGGAAGGPGRGRIQLPRGFLPLALGMTALELYNIANDDSLSRDERTVAQTEAGGGLAGGLAGAAAGAALGSVVPLVGTAIGGVIGGMLGYAGGRFAGGMIGESITGTEESEFDRLRRNLEAERQEILNSAAVSGIETRAMTNRLAEIQSELSGVVSNIQTPQSTQQDAAEQARRNLIAEREQILQEAVTIGMTSQEQQVRLAEIYSQLATQTESTNTMIDLLSRLNTTMERVRDIDNENLELQGYLAQIAAEQLAIEREIEKNTEGGSDISRGGLIRFGGGR